MVVFSLGEGRSGELGGSCLVGGVCGDVTLTCQDNICRCDAGFFPVAGACSK